MRKLEYPSLRQEKILTYIRDFKEEYNYSPSIRDIQAALTISSTSVVDYNLKELVKRGLIRRARNVSRTIELIEQEQSHGHLPYPSVLMLPVAGSIAAGQPIPVFDELQAGRLDDRAETIEITPDMVGRYAGKQDGLFVLRVKGHSMIEDLISDGDLVVMHSQDTAEDGETIAAWLEDEKATTLKRIYREQGGRIRLQPANATMKPIYTDEANLRIQGRVVAVIRQVF